MTKRIGQVVQNVCRFIIEQEIKRWPRGPGRRRVERRREYG